MDDREWIKQADEAARRCWDRWDRHPVQFAVPLLPAEDREWVDAWRDDTPTARYRRNWARIDWSQ